MSHWSDRRVTRDHELPWRDAGGPFGVPRVVAAVLDCTAPLASSGHMGSDEPGGVSEAAVPRFQGSLNHRLPWMTTANVLCTRTACQGAAGLRVLRFSAPSPDSGTEGAQKRTTDRSRAVLCKAPSTCELSLFVARHEVWSHPSPGRRIASPTASPFRGDRRPRQSGMAPADRYTRGGTASTRLVRVPVPKRRSQQVRLARPLMGEQCPSALTPACRARMCGRIRPVARGERGRTDVRGKSRGD
jgi:hypothetical protein